MGRYEETRVWIRANAKREFWQRAPFTAVRLVATWQGQEYHALGFAKCSPRDNWEFGLGETIALGRAEVDMARQIEQVNPYLPVARAIQEMVDMFTQIGQQVGNVFEQAKQESEAQSEFTRIDEWPPREKEEEQ